MLIVKKNYLCENFLFKIHALFLNDIDLMTFFTIKLVNIHR